MADFFDRVKSGFNKGVATVSTGSKTMIEKTKINAIIKGLEDEKKQLAEIIGNKVFAFCTANAEGDIPRADVISICNEIVARDEQIAVQRQRIAELDAEMEQVKNAGTINISAGPCSCGYTNAPGAKFCAKCGNKLA